MRLRRIELTVHTTNDRAIAAYRRCGFQIEGVRQSSLLVDERYVDEYLMAVINDV
jgi:RimJ/RimL family protein N-acetyltransferase